MVPLGWNHAEGRSVKSVRPRWRSYLIKLLRFYSVVLDSKDHSLYDLRLKLDATDRIDRKWGKEGQVPGIRPLLAGTLRVAPSPRNGWIACVGFRLSHG